MLQIINLLKQFLIILVETFLLTKLMDKHKNLKNNNNKSNKIKINYSKLVKNNNNNNSNKVENLLI